MSIIHLRAWRRVIVINRRDCNELHHCDVGLGLSGGGGVGGLGGLGLGLATWKDSVPYLEKNDRNKTIEPPKY